MHVMMRGSLDPRCLILITIMASLTIGHSRYLAKCSLLARDRGSGNYSRLDHAIAAFFDLKSDKQVEAAQEKRFLYRYRRSF